ncbi:MAG TPA: IS200/IS605 family transposase, partial [Dehalococcoidia bacterium]|nr:IS200/IS605 family transposase [Dehalococcoidia bacterium]
VLEVFHDVARKTAIRLLAAEAIEDHVHLVLQLGAEKLLSTAIHDLKGASAREVFRRFPELRSDMGTNTFWQARYGWRRLPDTQIEIVTRYVNTQAERPLRHE